MLTVTLLASTFCISFQAGVVVTLRYHSFGTHRAVFGIHSYSHGVKKYGNSSVSTIGIGEDKNIGKETKKRGKKRNKHNELLLENVLLTTAHDGNVILHIYRVCLSKPVL